MTDQTPTVSVPKNGYGDQGTVMPYYCASIQRRSLLRAGVSALALSILPGGVFGTINYHSGKVQQLTTTLLTFFENLDAPATIGRRYLQSKSDESDPAWLCKQLLSEPLPTDPEGLRCALAEKIRTDFSRRDIAQVDGWLLARTEVRLCALASLAGGSVS